MKVSILSLLLPELILIGVACALFLLGLSRKESSRRLTAIVALLALLLVFIVQAIRIGGDSSGTRYDQYGGFINGQPTGTVRISEFAQYIKLVAAGVAI